MNQTADLLRVTSWTVRRLLNSNDLTEAPRDGRTRRILTVSIVEFIERKTILPDRQELSPMSKTELPELLTLEEVAEKYGWSLRSLWDGARARKFAHVRFGNRRYMTPEQVAALVKAKTEQPPQDEGIEKVRARRSRRVA